jgi:hypothetical protein
MYFPKFSFKMSGNSVNGVHVEIEGRGHAHIISAAHKRMVQILSGNEFEPITVRGYATHSVESPGNKETSESVLS